MMTLVNSQLWTIMYSSDSELFEEHKTGFEIIIGTLQILGETPMEAVGIVSVPKVPTSVAIPWSSESQTREKDPMGEVLLLPSLHPSRQCQLTSRRKHSHCVSVTGTPYRQDWIHITR